MKKRSFNRTHFETHFKTFLRDMQKWRKDKRSGSIDLRGDRFYLEGTVMTAFAALSKATGRSIRSLVNAIILGGLIKMRAHRLTKDAARVLAKDPLAAALAGLPGLV